MATAIEKALGDVRSQTELLSKHLVQSSPGGHFTQTTFPSSSDVDDAIEAAHAEVLAWFAAFDYDIVLTNWSDIALQYVAFYNALGAAYRLENSHTGALFTAQAKSRADGYWRQYQKLKEDLVAGMSFVEIGIPRITANVLQGSVTGTSKADKTAARADTDRVQPFFERDGFKDPQVKNPVSTELS